MAIKRGPHMVDMAESMEGFIQQKTEEAKVEVKIEESAHQTSFSKLLILTITVYFGFTMHGLSSSIPGATLLDLAHLSNSSIPEVSWVFTGRSLGGIVGAILMPLVSRVCSSWLSIGVFQVLKAVLFCLVPLCRTNAQMIGLFSGIGVMRSHFDTASFIMVLDLWGPMNGPWLSGMTAMYGIGALLAPLIAEPFVTSLSNHNNNYPNRTSNDVFQNGTHSFSGGMIAINYSSWIDLIKLYMIIGILTAITGLFYFVGAILTYRYWDIYNHNSKTNNPKTDSKLSLNCAKEEETECNDKFKCALSFRFAYLVLLSIFNVAFCLIQLTFGMFLVTFAVTYAKWNKSAAVFLLSVFHAVSTASRIFVALLTKYIQPKYILFSFIAITVTSAVTLGVGSNVHFAVLWVAACGFAIGNSPLVSVGITYTHKYIRVTPTVSAITQISCTTAAVLSPFTLGGLYETVGPVTFVYILLVGSCLLLSTFTTMHILSCQYGERTITEVNVNSEDK